MKNFSINILFLFLCFYGFSQDYEPELVKVEGGTYLMGNQESEYMDEYPRHKVTLDGFYMSKYEITAEKFSMFSNIAGIMYAKGSGKKPVSGITWFDAVMYCNWLSTITGYERCYKINRDGKKVIVHILPDANGYRLPTEAEWEYAARGGKNNSPFAYSGSNDAREVAWFMDTGKRLHEVGLKKANALGIYDMSGNIKEWCWDYYDANYYENSPEENPLGPEHGSVKVLRGGSYNVHREMLRVNKRYFMPEDERDITVGFRIVRSL